MSRARPNLASHGRNSSPDECIALVVSVLRNGVSDMIEPIRKFVYLVMLGMMERKGGSGDAETRWSVPGKNGARGPLTRQCNEWEIPSPPTKPPSLC